MAEAAEEQLDF